MKGIDSTVARFAAAVGLTCGFLDAALAVSRLPDHSGFGFQTLAAMASAPLLTSAIYLICWYLLVGPLTRPRGISTGHAALSLAITICLAHAALIVAELLSLAILPDLDAKLAGMTAVGWVLILCVPGVLWIAARRLTRNRKFDRLPGWLATATAVATLSLLTAAALRAYGFGNVASRIFVLLIVAAPAAFVLARFGRAWSSSRWLGGLTTAAAAGAAFAVVAGPPVASPDAPFEGKVRNVILITVDTLRWDALSCYNSATPATPAMDRLAADGVVYERAYSTSPWTLPAMGSILTGVTPTVHGLGKTQLRLPRKLPSIAERFKASGYVTLGAETNYWLHKLTDGFQEYEALPGVDPVGVSGLMVRLLVHRHFAWDGHGDDLTSIAGNWIQRYRDKPFFIWLHYYDVHSPYEPPADYMPGGMRPNGIDAAVKGDLSSYLAGAFFATTEQARYLRKLYLAEVQYEDDQIGRLIAALEEADLYDDSLIALTSDHGEEFLEHGGLYHGVTMYDEVLRVPLIMKVPGKGGASRVDSIVSTRDIAGTLLEAAGIAKHDEPLPALAKGSAPAVAEGVYSMEPAQSMISDGWKYVRHIVSGREQLYDLARDADEKRNLAEVEPEQAAGFREQIEEYNALSRGLRKVYAKSQADSEVDSETLRRLRSLGYVQ